ncbi:pectinesterase PemB [Edaphovirga cremea]|uniref:pectinesterase PemB n=1 Tax=Edaphovirga cremea TaxID=2267246 RepID=UPI0014760645|nr:pectinesterase PemB [Edaphovirga cremea]
MTFTNLSRVAAALSVSLLLAACSSNKAELVSTQLAPGTATRPVLSADEAQIFTQRNYFALSGQYAQPLEDHWIPSLISTDSVQTQFVVGSQVGVDGATFTSVQEAVSASLRARNHGNRIFIKLLPGTYTGTVYVPAGAAPITLFGAGESADQVVIQLALDSMISPETYRNTVNPKGEYLPGDRAWYMYNVCATKQKETIDTICSAVVWSQSNNFQMKNLTVVNSLLDTVDGGAHQGVALRTDGDKAQLENVRLIGRQDTFFVNTSDIQNNYVTDHYSRVYVKNSYIEGDVDYVFGRANAVFDNVEFHTVSSRGAGEAYVFAPDTMPQIPFGFLVINSRLTGDGGFQGDTKAKLGRAWDQGARETGYVAGQTANGQLVIRDSRIDSSYDVLAPWGAAATTNRPFAGNIAPNRDLNDVNFNRLWEYNNIVGVGEK